jgi:hypothetical protein
MATNFPPSFPTCRREFHWQNITALSSKMRCIVNHMRVLLEGRNDFKIIVVGCLQLSHSYLHHALLELNIHSVMCEEGGLALNNIIANFVASDSRVIFIPYQMVEHFHEIAIFPPNSHILVPHAITLGM